VKRVAEIFDDDSSGEVDFKEFVVGLTDFTCNAESEGDRKLRFAFNVYDLDKDGFISNEELYEVSHSRNFSHILVNFTLPTLYPRVTFLMAILLKLFFSKRLASTFNFAFFR
jgi:hypothetical protein